MGLATASAVPAITSCSSCPCGRAAGVPFGGRCPLVDRRRGRDELICLEGQPATTVWFVKRGAVLLSRGGADGVDRTHAVRGPGAFVGLEALVRGTYADTARASEPSVLCGIARGDLDRWFGPAGTPARMALEQTLHVAAEEPLRPAAVDGSAPQRVARWLLDEADRAPRVQRHVLASLLGMTPETLSRALARLRDEGAIELTRQLVAIRDRARLERLGH
jgi:CRP-like cAMP-binding protein